MFCPNCQGKNPEGYTTCATCEAQLILTPKSSFKQTVTEFSQSSSIRDNIGWMLIISVMLITVEWNFWGLVFFVAGTCFLFVFFKLSGKQADRKL